MKKNIFLLFVIALIHSSYAQTVLEPGAKQEIFKLWEINIKDIFPKQTMSKSYSPLILDTELVFGSENGIVKTVDVDTKSPAVSKSNCTGTTKPGATSICIILSQYK